MLVSTVSFVDMYIDVQNLALLVVLPRANQFSQYAQFALFTKVFLAHTLIDKNTTSRGEPQVFFEPPISDVLIFSIFNKLN